MAWQGTRKANKQAAITERPVRREAPGEGGRERGASCGQVCEQGRKPETLTAILRSSARECGELGSHGGCEPVYTEDFRARLLLKCRAGGTHTRKSLFDNQRPPSLS